MRVYSYTSNTTFDFTSLEAGASKKFIYEAVSVSRTPAKMGDASTLHLEICFSSLDHDLSSVLRKVDSVWPQGIAPAKHSSRCLWKEITSS